MQFTLDPEFMRGLMVRRRAATDMQLPMNERAKVYFMSHRAQLLSNFSLTAGAWMMLLHGCSAQGADRDDLERLKAEVVDFKEWAEEGLQELRRMGLQETIEDGDLQMPDDPELAAALRRMLESAPRPPGQRPPRS